MTTTAGATPPSLGDSQTPEPAKTTLPSQRRAHRIRVIALVALVPLAAGAAVGWNLGTSQTAASTNTGPHTTVGTRSSYTSLAALDTAVDPAIVDVVSILDYGNAESEGTGIVLSSIGEILTNNHVIEDSTSIRVTDIGNGKTYTASVVGYDVSADIAVLQLQDASRLSTADIGNSSSVTVGQSVVALGNAGGLGGTPSAASGTVTSLDQSITASDEYTGSSEQLSDLIETNADVQSGDSGGPLVNMMGQVVALDTAASSDSGSEEIESSAQGYSIPINEATLIAKEIEQHRSSITVHIGPSAFLGVEVSIADQEYETSGVEISAAMSNTPAAAAGLESGDLITSVGGVFVDSDSALSDVIGQYEPGNKVTITWTDQSGLTHSVKVVLSSGPAE